VSSAIARSLAMSIKSIARMPVNRRLNIDAKPGENAMKLYPNRDNCTLFARSMGKALKITAIYDNDNDANYHMSRAGNNDAVICVSGNLVFLADVHDKGLKIA